MSDVSILLSSAGRRGALVELLREGARTAGASVLIVATDRSELSAAGHLSDAFEIVPPVDSPDYVDSLADVVQRHGIDVIVPTIDTELPILAAHRAELGSEGATVLISSPEVISICSDKKRSSQWLSSEGFAVPVQYQQDQSDDLDGRWPRFFKPINGSSSVGAQPVASPAEVQLAVGRFGPGVVEELITGDEYTIDCWADVHGECLAAVPRIRLAIRAGESAKGVTARANILESEARSIVGALPGARGPITIQAMVNDDGPRFIEVNPRFSGGYPLTHAAGARFTAALVAETIGKPIDPDWFSWKAGQVMLRYDTAVFLSESDLQ